MGRGRVTLTALRTQGRAGTESASGKRIAIDEGICFLSWQRQPAVGALRAQEGPEFPEPGGFILRPKGWLYHGKPDFPSPQLILRITV